MVVALDDTHHAMWLLLEYRDYVVTAIQAAIERGPATPCGGATAGLQSLVGLPLAAEVGVISELLPCTSNCTHLIDLARLAMATARRGGSGSVEWRIAVPDLIGEAKWVEIERDGIVVHRWRVADGVIKQPESLSGYPVMKGFYAWAREMFSGEELEAATMLQRGIFVSCGRKHIVDEAPPVPLRLSDGMAGACHSYSEANLASATNVIGYVRDFSDGIAPGPIPDHIERYFRKESTHDAN